MEHITGAAQAGKESAPVAVSNAIIEQQPHPGLENYRHDTAWWYAFLGWSTAK